VWWKLIHDDLREIGFKETTGDQCVYVRRKKDELSLLALYVDDLVVASTSIDGINQLEGHLRAKYSMKPIGDIEFVLGLAVRRDRKSRVLTLSQRAFAETALKRFNMMDCKPYGSPAAAGSVVEESESGTPVSFPYQRAVGTLFYLANGTRPDLSYAVAWVARFSSCPTEGHVKAVKRILRYLKGTMDIGIKFGGSPNGKTDLIGYVDADYAGCMESRRSTSGFVFMYNGGPISWSSKRQECIALSTTEAEYIALSAASREAIWLRRLLGELGQHQEGATTIYEDNQATIMLSTNAKTGKRTKHIDVRYHFVRETISKGDVELVYCPSEEMVADMLTKALPVVKFKELRQEVTFVDGAPVRAGGSVRFGAALRPPRS
jgi:hypothetical protein